MNTKEQHSWSYVYFAYYLSKKNPMQFTGVDTYVMNCLKQKDQKWLPDKTTFRIQNHKQVVEEVFDDDDTTIVLNMVHGGINDMKKELMSLGDRLSSLEEKKEGGAED